MINVEKELQLEGREEQSRAEECQGKPEVRGPSGQQQGTRHCLRRRRLSAGREERDGGNFTASQFRLRLGLQKCFNQI